MREAPWQIRLFSVYADKGYDSEAIRCHLKDKDIVPCIPYRKNTKSVRGQLVQKAYSSVRFVVERFFSWLKSGFHRTVIRYERSCDNYLGFVYLTSILIY